MTTMISHERTCQWILERTAAGAPPLPLKAHGSREGDAALEQHLATCNACREYAEQVARGVAAFSNVPVVADADLVRRTRAQLRAAMPPLVTADAPVWTLGTASLVGCVGLVAWALLAERLGVWGAGLVGSSPPMVWLLATLVWLLPSALAAAALVVSNGGRVFLPALEASLETNGGE